MSVNERIQRESVSHLIGVQRVARGEAREIADTLDEIDAEIASLLILVSTGGLSVEGWLLRTRELIDAQFEALEYRLERSLSEIAEWEERFTGDSWRRAIPASAREGLERQGRPFLDRLPEGSAALLSREQRIEGATPRDWIRRARQAKLDLVLAEVEDALVEGLSGSAFAARVAGRLAGEDGDVGVFGRGRQQTRRVAATALSAATEVVRLELVRQNRGLFRALQWLSVLDSRTSGYCFARNGALYDPDTFAPIGHSAPWGSGPGRLHWYCRSSFTPAVVSWKDLGLEGLSGKDRLALSGKAPKRASFEDWVKSSPDSVVREVLGPTRYAMWKAGKLPLDRFLDHEGDWVPLRALRLAPAA